MLWRSTYKTGNAIVDRDHKEIFGMVERLLENDFGSRSEKVEIAVGFLLDYVAKHFANEERLMDESGYPQAILHKKQHSDFAQAANLLAKKIHTNLASIDLSLEVNNTIVKWLAEHVMGSDRDLADHYRNWSGNQ